MAVDPLAGTGTSSDKVAAVAKKDQLGQDQFLQLMLAQLKNQDPTKPADPSEFLGQLAQFSTVTGIQEMKASVATLSDSLRSQAVLGGTSLVGHEVLAASKTADLGAEGTANGTINGAIDIPENAQNVTLQIKDSSGQLVRTMQGPTQEGTTGFSWDGIANNGTRAAAGTYTIEAIATVGGKDVQLETQLVATVGSVTIDPSTYGLTLNTELGSMALANVRRVM